MAYNDDLIWTDIVGNLEYHASDVKDALIGGEEAYYEWQSFRAGRTNAEIATALSVTETAVSEADAAYAALLELYQAANNVAIAQADRFYSLRKFT